eukprot:TRINITY_DN6415_c0_g1_i1.p2 TRINITY_DN6415_c0_g1~~TRINITY_DN6415_c0_g1_i1.p2  ORF type:complete len:204 (-),score=20.33 TRINITY_DN6415_c0_g1_i1:598-1209(-)
MMTTHYIQKNSYSFVKAIFSPQKQTNKQLTAFKRTRLTVSCQAMQQQQLDHAIHGKKMQKILEGQKSLDQLKEFFEGQDYGNIVHFEHINLEVPDMEIARLFYGEGLGLTMDPGTTGKQRGGAQVLWFNIGRQQFHIAKGPVAQHVNGRICLFVPDTDIVYDNLQYVDDLLKDTKFEFHKEEQGLLEIVDPWGNVFFCNGCSV